MTHSKSRPRDAAERRIRKEIRALLKEYDAKRMKQDDLVRRLYELVDDERRRAFMSVAPAGVQAMYAFNEIRKAIAFGGKDAGAG